jgi:hypothetical protein
MLDGRADEAVEQELMGKSTIDRYRKVMRQLETAPDSPVDCRKEKVAVELVEIIRTELKREKF